MIGNDVHQPLLYGPSLPDGGPGGLKMLIWEATPLTLIDLKFDTEVQLQSDHDALPT